MEKSQIVAVVFAAVEEVNQQLRRSERIEKSLDIIITGEGGRLDSLGFVNLIFAIEQKVEQQLHVSVTLADYVVSASDESAFRTLGSLADFLLTVLREKNNG